MKEIGLVTLITEQGYEIVLEAYNDIDAAEQRAVDLITETGDPDYFVQYVELK